jgi:hypothetical protein
MNKEQLEQAAAVLDWLSEQLKDRNPHEALNCSCAASLCIHWAAIVAKKEIAG